MEPKINWKLNTMPKGNGDELEIMALENVAAARAFHESFPQYAVTPLAKLDKMADHLGLHTLCIKDESYRFGLNAFKVLGGSFAMAKYIAKELGRDVSEMTYDYLTSQQLKDEFGQATFCTATDGNHGRGVAWAANKLGQKAIVHMPKGSSKYRFDNIAKENAKVTIEGGNYDECVRIAAAEADATPHGVIVQDTAWEGYTEIPSWIMQGYGTMGSEALDQLEGYGVERPDLVILQAGVGCMAGAICAYIVNRYKENPPKIVIAEAAIADCLYQGAVANDGKYRIVDGDLQTIMAGLACGEPNIVCWEILRDNVAAFCSCPDWVAAKGMRMLAAPVKGDPAVCSGESGAVGMGLIATIMTDPDYAELKEALELNENSKVLLFSTEGDTDPGKYKSIVWGGEYATV